VQDGLPISASAPSRRNDQVGAGQGLGNRQVGNDATVDLVVRVLQWPARSTTLPQPKQSTTRNMSVVRKPVAETGIDREHERLADLKLLLLSTRRALSSTKRCDQT